VAAGSPDNVQASGQTIAVSLPSRATTLGFLGSATNGDASGTATITYTDGTTQTFTLAGGAANRRSRWHLRSAPAKSATRPMPRLSLAACRLVPEERHGLQEPRLEGEAWRPAET
jgi:hypothetical protein